MFISFQKQLLNLLARPDIATNKNKNKKKVGSDLSRFTGTLITNVSINRNNLRFTAWLVVTYASKQVRSCLPYPSETGFSCLSTR